MIVLWGPAEDPPLAAVRSALDRRAAPYRLLDQRRLLPGDHSFDFGRPVGGHVDGIDLGAVRAAFIRPQDQLSLPETLAAAADGREELARLAHWLTVWTELTPAVVVNRLSAQASNTSKLYQLALIRAAGFAVPDSLATTDPEAASAFVARHGSVIYKSLSGVRSVVRRLGPDESARLADVRACPTLFQEFVPGTDYRVHVAGDRVFATMVSSEADDYRYDRLTERICVELPDALVDRCRHVTRRLGLVLSGIDLRRSPAGDWVCFEVNPSPAFTYFEQDTEIADAVAGVLAGDG